MAKYRALAACEKVRATHYEKWPAVVGWRPQQMRIQLTSSCGNLGHSQTRKRKSVQRRQKIQNLNLCVRLLCYVKSGMAKEDHESAKEELARVYLEQCDGHGSSTCGKKKHCSNDFKWPLPALPGCHRQLFCGCPLWLVPSLASGTGYAGPFSALEKLGVGIRFLKSN